MYYKDYIVFATIISCISDPITRSEVAKAFASYLSSRSPTFNRETFLIACGAIPCQTHP